MMTQNPNRDVADTHAMVFERIDGLGYRLEAFEKRLHIIEQRIENEGRCLDEWMNHIADDLLSCMEDVRAIKTDRLNISARLTTLFKKHGINL